MSCSFSKLITKKETSLDCLKNKIVAIDIAPWLYKYLYMGKHDVLKSNNGVITSHITGFLNILKKFKQRDIKLIICLDGPTTNNLKNKTVKKRIDNRKKKNEELEKIALTGLVLDEKQVKQKIASQYHIGLEQKEKIVQCCNYLGVPYYYQPGVQGELACTYLKKIGVADQCMTLDKDAFLYGTSFFANFDLVKNTVEYYDYEENLSNLGLSSIQYLYACLASGCDYTAGIPKIGPKTAHKLMIQDPENFMNRIRVEITNSKQLIEYIKMEPGDQYLVKTEIDITGFINFLKELDFNPQYVLNLVSYLTIK